ncbi:unnamed protein product [Effrenium voratum]|nr:unnamed protein product [Effrenium voratum]
MSWGAKEFLKELDDVQKLLAFGAPVAVQDGMIQALWKKIEACDTLLPSDLLAMLQGIKDSALPERSSQFLNEKLMMKACSATQAQQGHKVASMPQSLTSLPAYLTDSELAQLMTGDPDQAPHVMVKRLRLVGLTSLKEDTKKHVVSFLSQVALWHGFPKPTPDEVYEMSGTFSKLFHDSDIVSPVAPIRVYPALPTELGADWIAQVYGQEKPSMKVLTSLRGLSVGCPVRSTSSLLSRNMAKNVQMDDRDSAQFAALLGKLVGVGQIPVDKSQNEPKITFFNRAKELQNTASSSMSLPALQEMQKIPTPVSSMKASALPESASPGPSTVAALTTAEPSPGHALPSPAEIAIAHAHVPASVAPEPEESAKPPKSLKDFEKEAMLLLHARAKKPRTEAKVEKAAEGQQIVGKRETLDEDLTISARHLTMASCELATDAKLLQSWDRLAQHSQSDNKGTFKMRQQASGWTFSEAALLMPLQHFLETYCVLPEVQVYKDACVSWFRLLDMLVVSATSKPQPGQVLAACEHAMNLSVAAGWGDRLRPKFHWALHYEACLNRFSCLPACWSLERKHKVVRKYGSASTNTRRFDQSLLEEVTAEHLAILCKAVHFQPAAHLVDPYPVPPKQVSALVAANIITATDNCCCSSLCHLASGAPVSKKDFVLHEPPAHAQGPMRFCCGRVEHLLQVGDVAAAVVSVCTPLSIDSDRRVAKWQHKPSDMYIMEADAMICSTIHNLSDDQVTTLLPGHLCHPA